MRISTMKTKTMAFQRENHIRCKIMIDNKIIEQVSSFKYLGFDVSYCLKEDIKIKLNKFQGMCGMIQRTLKQKTLQTTQLKFYKIMAVPMLTYASENWMIN
jgi:Tfp pilus assembly pilus retraction ATPase PilT